MSDSEGSQQEQPSSPEEHSEEDPISETNEDHPEESENAEEETGSRKRSLSISEEQHDDSPSVKIAKEEISLAIICDSHAAALESINQTETSIVFHLKVKVTKDLSLATIPDAVEELLSDDPETKSIVILLPQGDLRHFSIPLSCRMNNCSGKGLQHTLPLPVTQLATYMDSLKNIREELLNTYPDTDFYWITPGPVDFQYVNRQINEKKHGHHTTIDMWKTMIANYNKRLKVLMEEIPGNMTINWFARSCWQNRDNRGKKSDYSIQRVLQGDLVPIRELGLIIEGEDLTVKGGQAMWMIIRKKIKWFRKSHGFRKVKAETEKDSEPSGSTSDDIKKKEEVDDKAEEDAHTENDLNESQKKICGKSTVKTTIIGDSWNHILSEIDRWHPDPNNRINVKAYPDLTIDSVIEKVDEVLSEEADTKNLVLSVFQNYVLNGLSAEYVENENAPCAATTVEDLMEKASDICKYIKKSYPEVKIFWVAPGPVGYYIEKDNKLEEMNMEAEVNVEENSDEQREEEKKKEEIEEEEDKEEVEEIEEKEDKNEDEIEEKEDRVLDKESVINDKKIETETEEEEKEEDPERRKLRRACSRCNSIALLLRKRLHFRFKKHLVDWFEVFASNKNGYSLKLEGKILEGKVDRKGYLDEDSVNLSEIGGNELIKIIIKTISGEEPHIRESDNHVSARTDRKVGGIGNHMNSSNNRSRGRGRGRGRVSSSSSGRGGGSVGWNDGGMGRRPNDNRSTWNGRGSGQQAGHNAWGGQGGGNWKGGQHQRAQDMLEVINRERNISDRREGNWGRSDQFMDPRDTNNSNPWNRNAYSRNDFPRNDYSRNAYSGFHSHRY